MPSTVRRFADESLDQRTKDRLVDDQRETRTRLAVGRAGERVLGERAICSIAVLPLRTWSKNQ